MAALKLAEEGVGEGAPLLHASRHASNGADPITPESIGAVSVAGPFPPHADRHAQIGADPVEPASIGAVSAADLASTSNGKGASMVGVEDPTGEIDATTVEGALVEIASNAIYVSDIGVKTLTIAAASNSGFTDPDPAWVGATVIGVVPVSGNDQIVASVAVGADGAVTVTTAGNETADATFRVTAILD